MFIKIQTVEKQTITVNLDNISHYKDDNIEAIIYNSKMDNRVGHSIVYIFLNTINYQAYLSFKSSYSNEFISFDSWYCLEVTNESYQNVLAKIDSMCL